MVVSQDEVGRRIRKFRKAAGMSQTSLGLAVGTDGTTITRIEAGKTTLSLARFLLIAEALGVETQALISESDDGDSYARAYQDGVAAAARAVQSLLHLASAGPDPLLEGEPVTDEEIKSCREVWEAWSAQHPRHRAGSPGVKAGGIA